MQKKRIVLGMLDTQGFEMVNRVYSGGGVAPTERAQNSEIYVLRRYGYSNERENTYPEKN